MRDLITIMENAARNVLYHGTKRSNLPSIMTDGLRPDKTESILSAVFLTNCKFTADNYQDMQAADDWVILQIDFNQIDPERLGPDNFELKDLLDDDPDDHREWDDCSWEESLGICSQVAYHGVIPPSAIKEA